MLSQYPSVIYAETDYIVSTEHMSVVKASASSPLQGKDGYTHLSWGITQTGLDIFAEYVSNNTSNSINIAVVDSGVDSSHAFLQGHISSLQKDFVGDDGIANDPRGHGTFFAAPHATAAAAMLKLLYPNEQPEVIHYYVNQYTNDVESTDIDSDMYFGHGFMKISNRIITVPFTDVPESKYYYDGVYSGYGRGYLTGLTSTTFGPNINMERQDVAVVLYRMAGSPNVVYRNIFSDVSAGHYTREDFAVILYRYAQLRGLDTSAADLLGTYIDGYDVSSYARPAVRWTVAHGIMGRDSNYLWPQNNIIRAEITTMIYRFLCL